MYDCIVLVGYSGAGKTSIAKSIKRKFNYSVFEVGDYVVAESEKADIPPLEFMSHAYDNNDYEIIGSLINDATKDNKVIIVGPRHPSELSRILNTYDKAVTISIRTKTAIRRKRRRIQEKKIYEGRSVSKYIAKRDKVEKGWGLDETMSMCKYHVLNNGSIEVALCNIYDIIL